MIKTQKKSFGLWADRGRPSLMTENHSHSDIEINYLEDGELTYLIHGQRVKIPTRKLIIFWAAIPHQLLESSVKNMHWITIPLTWFLQWQLPEDFTRTLLNGTLVIEPTLLPADFEHVSEWTEMIESIPVDDEKRKIALLEIEARLRRIALEFQTLKKAGSKNISSINNPTKVEQMAEYIAGHYTQSIQVKDIAAKAGLNMNYASVLYRKTLGISLMESVIHHRLWHSQRLLTTTHKKMIDIAFESGFGSVSRFYEAFTRQFKTSPRKYRASVNQLKPHSSKA